MDPETDDLTSDPTSRFPNGPVGTNLRDPLAHCAVASGPPAASGLLRVRPEDFQVEEVQDRVPEGVGVHLWLRVRKRGVNTAWVAERLAQLAAVPPGDVGFAGLKDRHALATQWFSVLLGDRATPDWSPLAAEGIEVLAAVRHGRKLRRGELAGNRFTITVRELRGDVASLVPRLASVRRHGVPNYFGGQRFGRAGNNLLRAARLFAGEPVRDRHERGLYLSAARAHLFNLVLSRRVVLGTWCEAMPGEALMLAGSGALIPWIHADTTVPTRIARLEAHPTGPLWGKGPLMSKGACRALEESVLADWADWRSGLEAAGLRQERRSLRLPVEDLAWRLIGQEALEVSFSLPAGSFATAVLRELIDDRDALPDGPAIESS